MSRHRRLRGAAVYRLRGVAQSGSAFGWGPKGRWFKSSRPDFRISASRREGGESGIARKIAWIARLVPGQSDDFGFLRSPQHPGSPTEWAWPVLGFAAMTWIV